MLTNRSRAFTLIELLVVIAIIAVLIALLLARRAVGPRGGAADPVRQQPEATRAGGAQLRVDQRRLAARSRSCQFTGAAVSWKSQWGVTSRLAPFMEQGPLYNAINFTLKTSDPSNTTVVSLSLERARSARARSSPQPFASTSTRPAWRARSGSRTTAGARATGTSTAGNGAVRTGRPSGPT